MAGEASLTRSLGGGSPLASFAANCWSFPRPQSLKGGQDPELPIPTWEILPSLPLLWHHLPWLPPPPQEPGGRGKEAHPRGVWLAWRSP